MKSYSTLLIVSALALSACKSPSSPADNASPYAGQQERAVKALSADEIDMYLSGHGMGMARAAELNHYPGPRHVLDLRERLALTDEQAATAQQLFDEMLAEAMTLGRTIVTRETTLDSLFASGAADEARVQAMTQEIGTLNGRLRDVHLRAHLRLRDVLSTHQRHLYDQIRGYGEGGTAMDHEHMHQM